MADAGIFQKFKMYIFKCIIEMVKKNKKQVENKRLTKCFCPVDKLFMQCLWVGGQEASTNSLLFKTSVYSGGI